MTALSLAPPELRDAAALAARWLDDHRGEAIPAGVAETIAGLRDRIDQTLLVPWASREEVRGFCREARERGFFAVCVSPIHVRLAVSTLGGSGIRVAAVVGFPSGAHLSRVKAEEARRAIGDGADELDMVASIGLLRSGEDGAILEEVAGIVSIAEGRIVKVILETAALDPAEKIRGVRLCREAGASYVKTSTGFGPGGATEEDVRLLRREAGSRMGVKASGGIRTASAALGMVAAGADRIGTSAGGAILDGE